MRKQTPRPAPTGAQLQYNAKAPFSPELAAVVANRVVQELALEDIGYPEKAWAGSAMEIFVNGASGASVVCRFTFQEWNPLALRERMIVASQKKKPLDRAKLTSMWVCEGYEFANGDRKWIPQRWRYEVSTCQDAAVVMYLAVKDAIEASVASDELIDGIKPIYTKPTVKVGEFNASTDTQFVE